MQTATHSTPAPRHGTAAEQYPAIGLVTRPTVDTAAAAFYLNRRPQTLREWAMTGKVIKPLRVNGRLAWPVADIMRVMGVAA
jgi:hypothetical protein